MPQLVGLGFTDESWQSMKTLLRIRRAVALGCMPLLLAVPCAVWVSHPDCAAAGSDQACTHHCCSQHAESGSDKHSDENRSHDCDECPLCQVAFAPRTSLPPILISSTRMIYYRARITHVVMTRQRELRIPFVRGPPAAHVAAFHADVWPASSHRSVISRRPDCPPRSPSQLTVRRSAARALQPQSSEAMLSVPTPFIAAPEWRGNGRSSRAVATRPGSDQSCYECKQPPRGVSLRRSLCRGKKPLADKRQTSGGPHHL